MVDLSPLHSVNGHCPATSRNELIIRRYGDLGPDLRVTPFFDKLVRFEVPDFDVTIIVAGNDLGPISGNYETAHPVLVLLCHYLLRVFQMADPHSSVTGAGDNSSSIREICESGDIFIMCRDY